MARIRSIHPGIWTDEAFAMLGMAARVLLFGMWTEADDHGVFEWKPVALKMRIFPADKVDMEPLLDELTTFNCVRKFSHEGREYGLVRNFCRFQRPKKPNYRYFLPDEFRIYAGLKHDSSEPVPHQFGTGTEKSSQMEEEGGNRRKKERDKDTADAVPSTSSEVHYAFEAGVIKLVQKDFDKWKRAYSRLDLEAELLSLSEWATQQPKWFFALQGALAKRNREAAARAAALAEAAKSDGLTPDERFFGVGRTPGII